MGSTYLELTNRVIRKINEVELTETSFSSARGMQALCRDAVADAISEINQQRWEWPYHVALGTQVLALGQSEYTFPGDYKVADWSSFQIQKDETLGINSTGLTEVDIEEWYKYQKDFDTDNVLNGTQIPRHVFKTPSNGFGVTPNPERTYTLKYTYFKNPTALTTFDSVTDIPVEYNNIITFGALYHMNLFRENAQGVAIAENKFKDGIKNMYQILVKSSPSYAHDTRVNFRGGLLHSGQGAYHL